MPRLPTPMPFRFTDLVDTEFPDDVADEVLAEDTEAVARLRRAIRTAEETMKKKSKLLKSTVEVLEEFKVSITPEATDKWFKDQGNLKKRPPKEDLVSLVPKVDWLYGLLYGLKSRVSSGGYITEAHSFLNSAVVKCWPPFGNYSPYGATTWRGATFIDNDTGNTMIVTLGDFEKRILRRESYKGIIRLVDCALMMARKAEVR